MAHHVALPRDSVMSEVEGTADMEHTGKTVASVASDPSRHFCGHFAVLHNSPPRWVVGYRITHRLDKTIDHRVVARTHEHG